MIPVLGYILSSCTPSGGSDPNPLATSSLFIKPYKAGSDLCEWNTGFNQQILIDVYKIDVESGSTAKYGSTITKSKNDLLSTGEIILPSGSLPTGSLFYEVTVQVECNLCCGYANYKNTKNCPQKLQGRPVFKGKSLVTKAGQNADINLKFENCMCNCD